MKILKTRTLTTKILTMRMDYPADQVGKGGNLPGTFQARKLPMLYIRRDLRSGGRHSLGVLLANL
jgi:hypothetical protein